jgi:6-pyruvoyltetrahydropterin/6-carboxytetrahydropterin synthase
MPVRRERLGALDFGFVSDGPNDTGQQGCRASDFEFPRLVASDFEIQILSFPPPDGFEQGAPTERWTQRSFMVRLGRQVRFSINPFLDQAGPGFNAYASKPAGEGLAIYLALTVELTGPVAPGTGLLVNVSAIDETVRRSAVPVFAERIGAHLRRGEHVSLACVARMLESAWDRLRDQFPDAQMSGLALQLNPFRTVAMNAKEPAMLYFSEKFEFAATHKLWNDHFSEPQNRQVFGKCANPSGHGHNYIVEVTVKMPAGAAGLNVGEFEHVVDSELMQLVDHKNLNLDVPAFGARVPTVENLALFAWEHLAGRFPTAALHGVTVWESDRTHCSYYGPEGAGS